jgi:eukaryotic-like serine/threonine-protein kinase
MTNDPKDIDSILYEAVEIESAEERGAFLDNACGKDEVLRERVDGLVANHFKAGEFLEIPVVDPIATLEQPLSEKIGSHIGPYKLVEQIGEGGMGTVYLAKQQEPVRRKVALKVIKPGMDTKQVIARFETERQVLAILGHPNIAKVFDGGVTESGRPYFVMELVKGPRITDYCDGFQLSIRQRLELFCDVCRAVQHAHQKGIIHRDIKPSNILVTLLDDKPVPKVIDFGISKAVSGRQPDESSVTGYSQMVGTPLYMSPEQAMLGSADVDTRSDVYSLGVLLYELLTGMTPFKREQFTDASYDEVRRIIQEEEPPRISSRLSTHDAALDTIAENRHVDARTLSRQLQGELDWIVLKAMEKDRATRYESVSDLGKDVQRYLHDEPVEACPPSTAYRLKKFARRNKTVLATVTTVALALFLGAGVATWQAFAATDARDYAQRQQELAEMNNLFAEANRRQAEENLMLASDAIDQMLKRIASDQLSHGEIEHAAIFAEDAVSFYETLLEQSASPELRGRAADAYRQAGKVLGMQGEYEQADKALDRAVELLDQLCQEQPNVPEYQDKLAEAYRERGDVFCSWDREDKIQEAEEAYRISEQLYQKLMEECPHDGTCYMMELSGSRNNLGSLLWSDGRLEEAEELLQNALSLNDQYKELTTGDSTVTQDDRLELILDRGGILNNLGMLLREKGELDEAVLTFREARMCQIVNLAVEPSLREAQDSFYGILWNLAQTHLEQGNLVQAGESAEEMVREFPRRSMAYHEAARILVECLRANDSEEELVQSLDDAQVETYRQKAHELIAEAFDADEVVPEDTHRFAWFLATCPEEEFRDAAQAESLALDLIEDLPERGWGYQVLGVAQYRNGLWQEAVETLAKSDELTPDSIGPARFFFAMAYWQLDDEEAAREQFDEAVVWMEEKAPDDEVYQLFRTEAEQLLGSPNETEEGENELEE